MPESAQNNAVPAQTEQGPVPTPAIATTTPTAPAPSSSGLSVYDLGDTRIQYDEMPTASVTGSAPPPVRPPPPQDPVTGRFVSPTVTPETVAPASPQVSQYIANLAKDLGFSDEEIAQTPQPQLEREIYLVNRRLQKERRQDSRADLLDGGNRPPAGEGTTTPQPAAAPEPAWDDYEAEDEVNPGKTVKRKLSQDLHPALAKVLGDLVKENKELRSMVEGLSQSERQRNQEQFYSAVDRLFVTRPELFGDKPGPQMKPDDPLFQKRGAIVALMHTFKSGSMQERWERAVRMVYPADAAVVSPTPAPKPQPAPAPKNGTPRITQEQWDNAGLAVPTNRSGAAEPNGVDKATKNFAAKMREFESEDTIEEDRNFKP